MAVDMAAARILIVEDEAILALDLQHTIKELGYDLVGWVTTGEQATVVAREQRPDLILMDIHLAGEMDGIHTARIIHSQFDIPVIFLTAYADSQILNRAKSAQPFAYLVKPFQRQELRTNIEVTLHLCWLHHTSVRIQGEIPHSGSLVRIGMMKPT